MPKQGMPGAGPMAGGGMKPAPLNFDSLLITSRSQLTGSLADRIKALDKKTESLHDSAAMSAPISELAKAWEEAKNGQIAAYYTGLAAKLDNSEKKLTFAARLFLDLMLDEENPAVRSWEAKEVVDLAERSYKLDTSIEETKLTLATGYIEGTGEPMRGVQLLLGIVGKNPADIPANLLLGKMSIQSGQLDKAVMRFETVLKVDSLNKEGLYYLAQAYKEKGEKDKARQLLEKCKQVVNDPEFSRKADEEISLLK